MIQYILTLIYIACTTGGITFMKLGGDSMGISFKDGFTFKIGLLTFIGFALYLISFLLWQRMIVKYDLSTMVPIVTGIVQIVVLLIGQFIFKEQITPLGIAGACFIILGIILMAFSKAA